MPENIFIFFIFINIVILPIFCFNSRFARSVSRCNNLYSTTDKSRIESVDIAVKDWKESVFFYQELLELRKKNELESTAVFSLTDGTTFRILQSPVSDRYEIGEVIKICKHN